MHSQCLPKTVSDREPAEDVNGLMFLNGVQDSKSDIVDASAKVMPHMTCNIIVEEDR